MKLLSIDIGIKNLAYVIIEYNNNDNNNSIFNISDWNVINLCNTIPNCSTCKKNAKFFKENNYYCKQHTKNSNYKIPEFNLKNIHKQNLSELTNIAINYDLSFNKKISKTEISNLLKDYINNNCLNIIENINANDINLIDLGINLKNELNNLFNKFDISTLDLILLENQISPIANRMKTIQGMIAQYFINNNNYNIQFISSVNKLKLFTNQKTSYNERKKMSIYYTQEVLTNKNMNNNLNFFNNHSKKDDLADAFLQAIYYLCNFYNLNIK